MPHRIRRHISALRRPGRKDDIVISPPVDTPKQLLQGQEFSPARLIFCKNGVVPTVADVVEALEEISPTADALDFDRVGFQLGRPETEVKRAVVSLDASRSAVSFTIDCGGNLLLTHHPLFFHPLDRVTSQSRLGTVALDLAEARIACISAHTNWDAAIGGVNDELAHRLGLLEVRSFGSSAEESNLKLVAFVPERELERVISAASEMGAGIIGLYRQCAFYGPGTGTFIGGEGSHPTIGKTGQIETATEMRLEMILPTQRRGEVEEAVRLAHPYEEPAIDFHQLAPCRRRAIGRTGRVSPAKRFGELVNDIDTRLHTRSLAWGDPGKEIQRLAVVGGSADSEWHAAKAAGADALLTGEVKHHVAVEAAEAGFGLIASGHYATEQPGMDALRARMKERIPSIEWFVFEPEPGAAGRPT